MTTYPVFIKFIPNNWTETTIKNKITTAGFISVQTVKRNEPIGDFTYTSAFANFASEFEAKSILQAKIATNASHFLQFVQYRQPNPKQASQPFQHPEQSQQHQQQQQHQQHQHPEQSQQHQQQQQHQPPKPPKQQNSIFTANATKSITSCVLIGETGSGKSTLLNTLANYFTSGTVDKPTILIPTQYFPIVNYGTNLNNSHSESNVKNQAQSQTTKCTKYEFQNGNHTLFLYDTPGLNDTNGSNQDDKNLDLICDAVQNAVNVAAIILVLNGSSSRFTLTTRNLFNRLSTTLPDSILNNVLITFTNTHQHSCNFPMNELWSFFDYARVFYMNNSAFSKNPLLRMKGEIKPLKKEWDVSMKSCQMLTDEILKFGAVSTKDFETMRKIRHCIKSLLHDSQVEMGNLQAVLDQIETAEKLASQAKNDQTTYSNYTKQTTTQQSSWVECSYHSTICSLCDDICHNNCGLQEIQGQGSDQFQRCAAFSGKDCDECRGREKNCDYTTHYHARKQKQQVDQTIESTMDDIKAKYDDAIQALNLSQKNLTVAQQQRMIVEAAMNKVVGDVEAECKKLKSLCRNFNLAQELNILIEGLRMSKTTLKTVAAQKQAESMIKALTQMIDRINQEPTPVRSSNRPKDGTGFTHFNPLDDDDDEDEFTNNANASSTYINSPNGVPGATGATGRKANKKNKNSTKHDKNPTQYDYAAHDAALDNYLADHEVKFKTPGAAALSQKKEANKQSQNQSKTKNNPQNQSNTANHQSNNNNNNNNNNNYQSSASSSQPFSQPIQPNFNSFPHVTYNINVTVAPNDPLLSNPQLLQQNLIEYKTQFDSLRQIEFKQYALLESHKASLLGEITVSKGHHVIVLAKSPRYFQVYNFSNKQHGFLPLGVPIKAYSPSQLTYTGGSGAQNYPLVNTSSTQLIAVEPARIVSYVPVPGQADQIALEKNTMVHIVDRSDDASMLVVYDPQSKQIIEVPSTSVQADSHIVPAFLNSPVGSILTAHAEFGFGGIGDKFQLVSPIPPHSTRSTQIEVKCVKTFFSGHAPIRAFFKM